MQLFIEETQELTNLLLSFQSASLADLYSAVNNVEELRVVIMLDNKAKVIIKERFSDRAELIFHLLNNEVLTVGIGSTPIYKIATKTIVVYNADSDAFVNCTCFEAELIRIAY